MGPKFHWHLANLTGHTGEAVEALEHDIRSSSRYTGCYKIQKYM